MFFMSTKLVDIELIKVNDMRKIRKVIPFSVIRYYDRDGVIQTYHTIDNIRNVDKAIKVLMNDGIVNVLIDDIEVHKTAYVMDVNKFVANAERVPDNDIDKETDNNK